MAKPNIIDKTLNILPYIREMFGDSEIQKVNNKFDIFNPTSITKEKSVQRLSIVNQYDKQLEFSMQGGKVADMYYNQLMYSQSSDDKKRRLVDYRVMAQYPEVESALREICDEMFVRDDQGELIKSKLRGNYNDEVVSLIEKEFQKFISIYKFEEKGWKYAMDFITEGELYFENIVSSKKPDLGIVGVTRIAGERIDPLYYDLDNELIDCFILRAKMPDQYPFQWGKFSHASYGRNNQQEILFLNDKQLTYFTNDQWESEGKKFRISHLANAHRPYRQLSLIEDATIIYMLVRAPERLVFNIDTGTMPAAKSEQYVKRLMAQFWSKKTIGNDGRVENTYDPVSMIENYYFAQPRDGKGSSVTSIGGGSASPDNLEILNFFVQKLYKSLHVPLARLNSETAFSDGESITREELRFAKFIISVQKLWASSLKKSFIVHLKLRGRKIIENAKKLKIDNIEIQDKNAMANSGQPEKMVNNLQMSAVYKDDFNHKGWDYYDIVTESIDKKIERLNETIFVQKENLLNRLHEINDEIENNKSVVLVEDAVPEDVSPLHLEAQQIASSLDELNQKTEQLKEMSDDNTSWWDQYELKEEDIDVKFNEPSQFFALREQQIFQLKYDNFNNMSQNDMISNTFAQKIYLGYKDTQILANQEFLRRDAAFRWELAQIEQSGPDFREKALEEMQASMDEGGELAGLGGGGGGAGGGGSLPGGDGGGLPAFGPPPAGAGGEGAPEGGGAAPAPAEGEGGPPKPPTGESYSKEFLDKMTILLENADYSVLDRLIDKEIREQQVGYRKVFY